MPPPSHHQAQPAARHHGPTVLVTADSRTRHAVGAIAAVHNTKLIVCDAAPNATRRAVHARTILVGVEMLEAVDQCRLRHVCLIILTWDVENPAVWRWAGLLGATYVAFPPQATTWLGEQLAQLPRRRYRRHRHSTVVLTDVTKIPYRFAPSAPSASSFPPLLGGQARQELP